MASAYWTAAVLLRKKGGSALVGKAFSEAVVGGIAVSEE